MYSSLVYLNEENTMIRATRNNGEMVVIEPSSGDLWAMVVATYAGQIAAYTPPEPPDAAELLARERAQMRCSPAQMRIALHRAGKLAEVQAIADADAEASIVWEYATYLRRTSPFISALNDGDFTDTEIDDLFRAAMAIDDF